MEGLKTLFKGMSSWVQLIFLVFFVLIGIMVLNVIILVALFLMGFDPSKPMNLMQSVDFLRLNLFAQSPLIFLFPAVLWAYLFTDGMGEGLKIDRFPKWKFLVLGVVLIIIIQPFISFVGYYNNRLVLPESLHWLEVMMRTMEDSAAQTLNLLLENKSPLDIILGFILIAVFAGICEEFFFRGALQQIFKRIIGNYHVAVWLTAIIFSAIHMQFYGFVPRVILGALLGYLFVWSGNLWVPIIIHTLNNALSVAAYYIWGAEALSSDSVESFGTGNTLWVSLVSIVLTVLVMIYMSRLHLRQRVEQGDI